MSRFSHGNGDTSLVECKLASSSKLKQNLQHQVPVHELATETTQSLRVNIFLTGEEFRRVQKILRDPKLADERHVILIDARDDNKPSGLVTRGYA